MLYEVITITGVDKIYAVLGGFHLTESFFEKITEKTIEMLKALSPAVVVPRITAYNVCYTKL